jgi:hypothetical protein
MSHEINAQYFYKLNKQSFHGEPEIKTFGDVTQVSFIIDQSVLAFTGLYFLSTNHPSYSHVRVVDAQALDAAQHVAAYPYLASNVQSELDDLFATATNSNSTNFLLDINKYNSTSLMYSQLKTVHIRLAFEN